MSSYSTAAFRAAERIQIPAGTLEIGLEWARLVSALQEADATGAGPIEQGGRGQDDVGMNMVRPARGQAERRLAWVARQVDLDGDGLATDQLGETAELIHHDLKLAEHGLTIVRLAAGNGHRRRNLR